MCVLCYVGLGVHAQGKVIGRVKKEKEKTFSRSQKQPPELNSASLLGEIRIRAFGAQWRFQMISRLHYLNEKNPPTNSSRGKSIDLQSSERHQRLITPGCGDREAVQKFTSFFLNDYYAFLLF